MATRSENTRSRRLLDWVDLVRIYRERDGHLLLDDVARVAGSVGRRQAERLLTDLTRVAASLGVDVRRVPPDETDDLTAQWKIVIDDVSRLERALSGEFEDTESDDPLWPKVGTRKARIAAGLCSRCRAPSEWPGAWYCKEHNEHAKERARRRLDRFVKAGVCPDCKGPLDRIGAKCSVCLEAEARRVAEVYARRASAGSCVECGGVVSEGRSGVRCDSCAEDVRSRARRRHDRLRAAGLCRNCGKNPVTTSRSALYCAGCLDRERTMSSSQREKHYAQVRAYRERLLERGLCPRCGQEPLDEGKRTGRRCLDELKAKKAARKAGPH